MPWSTPALTTTGFVSSWLGQFGPAVRIEVNITDYIVNTHDGHSKDYLAMAVRYGTRDVEYFVSWGPIGRMLGWRALSRAEVARVVSTKRNQGGYESRPLSGGTAINSIRVKILNVLTEVYCPARVQHEVYWSEVVSAWAQYATRETKDVLVGYAVEEVAVRMNNLKRYLAVCKDAIVESLVREGLQLQSTERAGWIMGSRFESFGRLGEVVDLLGMIHLLGEDDPASVAALESCASSAKSQHYKLLIDKIIKFKGVISIAEYEDFTRLNSSTHREKFPWEG